MISAAELRDKQETPDADLQFAVEQKLLDAIENKDNYITLDFNTYGFEASDVRWLEKFGYTISRNSACLWWEVRWNE